LYFEKLHWHVIREKGGKVVVRKKKNGPPVRGGSPRPYYENFEKKMNPARLRKRETEDRGMIEKTSRGRRCDQGNGRWWGGLL